METPHDNLADDPLARLPEEPEHAHRALLDYEAMGDARTLDALAAIYRGRTETVPTRQSSTLKKWSGQWNWQERLAAAYDARVARERAAREAVWAQRREQVRDQSWELADKIRARAQELLEQSFLEEATVKRGGAEVTVLKPRWSMRDIATLAETYDKLARLAAGMDTDRQRVVIDGLSPADLESLDDAELDKLWEKAQRKK